ncbi:hypothetical protein EPR50_G00081020 [Perca flavescens]|uniref:Uncharacterized protein n=1 Tax=Perca flavescens TaxID=8167 RepID=A0A484D695_PERFV|nr:hypothetical protein EPR50_G00081020 [Perca flavescens]
MCRRVHESTESNKEEQCSRFSHWSETLRGQRSVACSQTGGQRKTEKDPPPGNSDQTQLRVSLERRGQDTTSPTIQQAGNCLLQL